MVYALQQKQPSRAWWRGGLVAFLLLAGCQSATQKANGYEALYDSAIPKKAYPTALKAISAATQLDENEPRRWIKLGYVLNLLGRSVAAAAAYQHALDLAPDNIDALENLSILAVRAGDYSGAKRYVEPLLLLAPNDLAGLFASGAIAAHEKHYADAEKIAAGMTAASPERLEGAALRVITLRAQNRNKEAIETLEAALVNNPDNSDFLLQLLQIYRSSGDLAGVRRMAIRLAPLFPNDPRYAMEAVRAYHADGREVEARAVLDKLIARYRFNPSMMTAIAHYWRDSAAPEIARREVLRLGSAGNPAVKAVIGNALLEMGGAAEAIRLLAPLAPDAITAVNVDTQIAYARALYAAGRKDDAARKVTAILSFDATNVPASLLRARLKFDRGDLASALNDAQLAATGDQTSEEAALLVAQIYLAMGNPALAEKAFGSARGDFPDSFAVVQAWSNAGDQAQ